MGFANIILLSKIIKSIQLKKINFLSYYCLLAFMFINIFFYRFGEHGTDRSAQILIFLIAMEIIIFLISVYIEWDGVSAGVALLHVVTLSCYRKAKMLAYSERPALKFVGLRNLTLDTISCFVERLEWYERIL